MNILHENAMMGPSTGSVAVASALSPAAAVRPEAKAASEASRGSGDATQAATSNITSDDFLTLLVSELKNQDPTQPTDPNAYIQQLVGVNSLQQLIQINQGLATIEPAANATGTP